MSDQTEEITQEQNNETEVIDDPFEKSFQVQLGAEQSEADEQEKTGEKPEQENKPEQEDQEREEEAKGQEQPPDTMAKFNSLLDTQFKRHDTTQSLRDWIEKQPELLNEILGQTIDFGAGKAEAKRIEAQTKEYLVKELDRVTTKEKGLDKILLENMAYMVDMPLKTLADFENNTEVDDPEEEFQKYQENLKGASAQVSQNRTYADSRNNIMFETFAKNYPGVDINEMAEDMQKYLNYSISKGQLPLPEDTAEIFYRGRNFQRLLDEAVKKTAKETREKVIKELNDKGHNPNIHDAAGDKTRQQDFDENDPFEKSWRDAQARYVRERDRLH